MDRVNLAVVRFFRGMPHSRKDSAVNGSSGELHLFLNASRARKKLGMRDSPKRHQPKRRSSSTRKSALCNPPS
jgi:hypothetical protein